MMNKEQQVLLKEWFKKQAEINRKAAKIEQLSTEGFKLINDFNDFTKGILNEIDEAWE